MRDSIATLLESVSTPAYGAEGTYPLSNYDGAAFGWFWVVVKLCKTRQYQSTRLTLASLTE